MAKPPSNAETKITEYDNYFEIDDPLLGKYPLDRVDAHINGLMADIIASPLGQRALDITQLSKAEEHVTIPGTHRFHRLGHVIALAKMTQRLATMQGATDDQKMAYVLKAAPSDLAHGPFSHATDITIEGTGGNEIFHESRVEEAFRLGGVNTIFQKRGIKVNDRGEMEGIKIPPWVESEAPDMCVDRLQYTLHEMFLWFDGSDSAEADEIRQKLSDIATLKDIDIDDEGRMVFKDIDQARLLAKGYSLLSTEHWNEPVNRIQLYLLIEGLKYSILNRRLPGMDEIDNGVTRKPSDYLYAIDTDVLAAMESEPGRIDQYLYATEGQLADIGREEQRRFTQFKRPIYERFLTDELAEEYPSQILNPGLVDFGPKSSRFEIQLLDRKPRPRKTKYPQVPQLANDNGNLSYKLFPLKNRRIDPLVIVNGEPVRLSEIDKNYASLLVQHQRIQESSLQVHVPTTNAYKDLLWRQARRISKQFLVAQEKLDPLSSDPKRRSIEAAADRARYKAILRGQYVDLR